MAAEPFVISDSSDDEEVPTVPKAVLHATENELGDEMTPNPNNSAEIKTNKPQIKLKLLEKPTTSTPLRKRHSSPDHETEVPRKQCKMITEADALMARAVELLSFALESKIQEIIAENEKEVLQNKVSEISQETSRRNIRVLTSDGIKIVGPQNEHPHDILTSTHVQEPSLYYQGTQSTSIKTNEPSSHATSAVPATQDASPPKTSCKLASNQSYGQDKDQQETINTNIACPEPKAIIDTLKSTLQLTSNMPSKYDQPSSSEVDTNSLLKNPYRENSEYEKTSHIIIQDVTIIQKPAVKDNQSIKTQEIKYTAIETTRQRQHEETESSTSFIAQPNLSPTNTAIDSTKLKRSHEEDSDQQRTKFPRMETADQITSKRSAHASSQNITVKTSQSVQSSQGSKEQDKHEVRIHLASEACITPKASTSQMKNLPSNEIMFTTAGPSQNLSDRSTSTTVKIPMEKRNQSRKSRWLPLSQEQMVQAQTLATEVTGPAPGLHCEASDRASTIPFTSSSNETTHQIAILENIPIMERNSSEQQKIQPKIASPLVQTPILEYQAKLSPKYSHNYQVQQQQHVITQRQSAEQELTRTAFTVPQKLAASTTMLVSKQNPMTQIETITSATQSFMMPESRELLQQQETTPYRIEEQEHREEVKHIHGLFRQSSPETYEQNHYQLVERTRRQEYLEQEIPNQNISFTAQNFPTRQSHALIKNLARISLSTEQQHLSEAAPSVVNPPSILGNRQQFSVLSYPDPNWLQQTNTEQAQAMAVSADDAAFTCQNATGGSNQNINPHDKGPHQPESFIDQSKASPPLSQPILEKQPTEEPYTQTPQKESEQLPTLDENVMTTFRDLSQKDPRTPKPAAQRPMVLKIAKWLNRPKKNILVAKISSPDRREVTNPYLPKQISDKQHDLVAVDKDNENQEVLESISNSCAEEINYRPTVIQNSPLIAKPTSSRKEAEQTLRYRLNLSVKDIIVNNSNIQERFEYVRNTNLLLRRMYEKVKHSMNNYCERQFDNATASTSK